MVRNLLLSLLLILPLAVRATASLNEQPVSDVIYGAAPGYRGDPSIASDGENFLVVWYDQRAWPPVLYSTRANRDGEPLDPTGIRIAADPSYPVVVFAGDAYVILWSTGHNLYGARISREGQVIDGPRLFVENVPIDFFTAASNGSSIIVAWRDRFDVLSAEGETLERDTILPVPVYPNFAPRLTSNGSGFLLAWWNSYGMPALQTLALDSRGRPIGTVTTIVTNAGYDIMTGSDGRDYVVLYSNVNTHVVESRSISADAKTIGEPFAVSGVPFGGANGVQLAWDGLNYLAISHGYVSAQSSYPQTVARMRIDAQGKPLDTGMSAVASGFEIGGRSVASNGHDVLLAWTGRRLYEDFADVYAVKVSAAPDPSASGNLISRSAIPQGAPSIAFSGRNYLVVRQEPGELVFNRFALNGKGLDGTGVRLHSLSMYRTIAPRVIFDGENYVVAWTADGVGSNVDPIVRVARVEPDSGAVLDSDGILVDQSARVTSFDLASDGQTTTLVWSDGRIHAARFNRYLQMLQISPGLSPPDMSAGNPAVAWSGSEWLIAFDEQFWSWVGPAPTVIHANLRAVRLSPLLTPLDPQTIVVAMDDVESNLGAHVASDGNEFALVWTSATYGSGQRVRARHMKEGRFVDEMAVLANGNASSVVWDGRRYAVAFVTPTANSSVPKDSLLTHFGRTGDPLPNDRMIISATPDEENSPRLAATGGGNVTATYTRVATEPLYGGVSRAFVREPSGIRGRPARSR